MNNYQLNTNWCLWYHNINDTNWKNNSYKNIYDIMNECSLSEKEELEGLDSHEHGMSAYSDFRLNDH